MMDRYKLVRWFFRRPILPLLVEICIFAPIVLAHDPSDVLGPYLFLLPWLALVFGVVNLPLVAAAFRAFRLDLPTRRNHAIEHATIHYLEKNGTKRFSGRADRNGFRLCGESSAQEIRTAFEQVQQVVRERGQLPYISVRCGSNVVTALGLALVLLTTVVLGSVLLPPSWPVRAAALASVFLVFVVVRRRIGNSIQRRFFMTMDFDGISLGRIRKIQAGLVDSGPVYFVETNIRAKKSDAV
jgi:hypothetical protein